MKNQMCSAVRRWCGVLVAGMALMMVPMMVQAAAMQPISGGVGIEGRAAHSNYPLKLVFATHKGAFLADINVTLYDTSGKEVTSAHSAGPWLFLDVPAGTYRVKAVTKDGKMASAKVQVSDKGQTVVNLTWSHVH